MGFSSGFAGGVTLTLSLAYFSVLAHQRNREYQASILRSNALALQNLVDPLPAPLPPSRAEIAAAQRATATEVVKDRWNHEVQNAVRWIQKKDWDEVREGVEDNVAKMWTSAFGQAEAGVEQAEEKLKPLAAKAKADADKAASDAKAKANAKLAAAETEARKTATKAEKTAKETAAKAEKTAKETATKTEKAAKDAANESKGMFSWAWSKGQEKAQDVVDTVKAAASSAQDKAKPKADGKVLTPLDPVEKALHQRYEKSGALDKSVEEALSERYKPMDKRDNTVLRGV